MNRLWSFLALTVVALLLNSASPRARPQDAPAAEIDSLIRQVISRFDAPGVAVAVVKDGRPLLTRGYGVRQFGRTEPVNEHTLFYAASVAKAFTVTALGIAADEGKLRIDDPVVKYLPSFKLAEVNLSTSLTVRDLMAHRTGLPRADMLMVSGLSNEATLARLAAIGSQAPIRTRFTYNNQMYLALGLLLEQVSGVALPDFLETRLLQPIGFVDGNARGLGHWPQGAVSAVPHARASSGVTTIDLVARAPYGAGGINASAADLAAWLAFQLGDGTSGGRKIVSAGVLAAEHAPNMLVPSNPTMPSAAVTAYGLGWFVHDYFGHKIVQHGGNGEGWTALVWMAPQTKLGIAVLTNMHNSAAPYAVAWSVADRLLGRSDHEWAGEYRRLEARLGPPPLPAAPALEAVGAAAAGEYEHPI